MHYKGATYVSWSDYIRHIESVAVRTPYLWVKSPFWWSSCVMREGIKLTMENPQRWYVNGQQKWSSFCMRIALVRLYFLTRHSGTPIPSLFLTHHNVYRPSYTHHIPIISPPYTHHRRFYLHLFVSLLTPRPTLETLLGDSKKAEAHDDLLLGNLGMGGTGFTCKFWISYRDGGISWYLMEY